MVAEPCCSFLHSVLFMTSYFIRKYPTKTGSRKRNFEQGRERERERDSCRSACYYEHNRPNWNAYSADMEFTHPHFTICTGIVVFLLLVLLRLLLLRCSCLGFILLLLLGLLDDEELKARIPSFFLPHQNFSVSHD